MLYVPSGDKNFGLTSFSTNAQPVGPYGTSVTPGTGDYGSYASVLSATAFDSFGILVNINSNRGAAACRNTLLKVGIDPAGGTAYEDRLFGLVCGSAGTYLSSVSFPFGGVWYFFPLFIPAGSTVAVAAFSSVATAFNANVQLLQKPPHPELIRTGSFVEAIGASGIGGTSITPGTTSEGAWTSLGTTTNDLWHWQIGMQIPTTDTSWGTGAMHLDLAVGDATNKDIIFSNHCYTTDNSENLNCLPNLMGCERDVPAGSNIYARAQFGATLDSYTVVAYGMGG